MAPPDADRGGWWTGPVGVAVATTDLAMVGGGGGSFKRFFSYLALFGVAIANLALLQKSKQKIEQRVRVCMLVYIGDREEIWDVGSQSHCKITRLILGEKQSNDV